ncbi:MAG: LolA family protein [Fimbriimonadaceae bacterium]
MTRWVAFLMLAAICALVRAQAGPSDPLLRRVLEAAGKARYAGERTVEYRRGLDRLVQTELVFKDGPRYRIEYLPGSPLAGQVVIENGRRRWVVRPGEEAIDEGPARGDDALARLRLQLADRRGFTTTVEDGEPVAGLPTRRVEVADKRGIVVQRLWVHPPTGIVLRREIFGPAGGKLGSFEFRRIDLQPRFSADDFEPPGRPEARRGPIARLRELARAEGFLPAHLPPGTGFVLDSVEVRPLLGRRVLMQVYRGGGRVLTLYQLPPMVRPGPLQLARRAGLNSYSWQLEGRSFVLVSGLPEERLRELAGRLVVR